MTDDRPAVHSGHWRRTTTVLTLAVRAAPGLPVLRVVLVIAGGALPVVRAGRTSVLISHRLNAVRNADRIAVLAEGRIVEQGDHNGLLAAGGEYARPFTLRAAGFQAEYADEPTRV